MTTFEFVKKYILHDSLIDDIEINDCEKTIAIKFDFAFWMQKWYKEFQPETGIIRVIFENVMDYSIPNNVDWSEISILEAQNESDYLKLALLNDMTDEYLEIIIKCENIIVIGDTSSK